MKRTLCLFCALILAVGICFSAPVTITASAAEVTASGNCGKDGDNLTWSLVDGTLTISGTGVMADFTDTTTVPWYSYRGEIATIVINKGVTSIGEKSFYYCTALTSVTIPESVTTIGNGAFYDCTALTSVTIPESVTTIGNGAFYDCTSLTTIKIPDSVTTIGESAFSGCTSLTSVTIPYSVTSIDAWAFIRCTSLTSVTIPYSVTTIGVSAFNGCTALTTVNAPCSWNENPLYTFDEGVKVNIERHTLENNTCTVCEGGKCGATESDTVTWVYDEGTLYINGTGGMTTTAPWKNYKSEITTVVIGSGVTTISNYAFDACTNLATVTIPSSVTTIGINAFNGCTSLTAIEIPDSVTTIEGATFYNCTALKTVEIPDSVTTIGSNAFYNCTALTTVNVPCSWNENPLYTFEDGVKVTIKKHTIVNNNCTVCKGSKCGETESDTVTWVYNEGTLYINGTGAMADFKRDTAPWYKNHRNNIKTIVIEKGVTTIGDYAFNNCTSLTTVTIPESVTTIGEYAFNNCTSLTTVTIPSSVTTIDDRAFYNCTKLTTVSAPCSWNEKSLYDFNGVVKVTITKHTIVNNNCTVCKGSKCGATSNDTVTWVYDKGTLYINGTGAMADFSQDTAPWYENYRNNIKTIVIEKGVTTIGEFAFAKCTSLAAVTIGEGVTTIGAKAFFGCTNLATVTIPNGVTTIGNNAFEVCTSLTTIKIPDSVTTLGNVVFYGCTNLAKVTIPNSVTTIGRETFSGCSALTTVTIPSSVTTIDNYAFQGCSALTTIEIPGSVTTIGKYAFRYCESLTTVTIPSSVTSIGELAFNDCTKLTTVNVPCSWNEKPLYTFEDGGAVNIERHTLENNTCTVCEGGKCGATESDTVTWFYDEGTLYINGTGAMANYDNYYAPWYENYRNNIKTIVIEKGVTTIGEFAFAKCTSLAAVTIGEGVTTIGNGAFYDCTSLTTIKIPDSVTTIGESAFEDCAGLESVTIPDSVTTISGLAFLNCSNLTSVTIPKNVTTIDRYAFDGCAALTSINVDGANTTYSSVDGVLFNADKTELICYPAGKTETSYTVPESVTTIDEGAFKDCTALTSVTIGEGVTVIDYYAFYGCSELTSVTIPESVTTIGDNAFYGCLNVTLLVEENSNAYDYASENNIEYITYVGGSGELGKLTFTINEDGESYSVTDCDKSISGALTIPNKFNGKPVTKIGNNAFSNCESLTSVVIPDSVVSLGEMAFYDCGKLETVTLSNKITEIPKEAFACCKSLKKLPITKNITSIGECAFNDSGEHGSVSLLGVTIGTDAFRNCGITELTLENCKLNGKNIFANNTIKKLTLSETNIPDKMFYGDSYIITLVAEDSVLGSESFKSCHTLKSVTVFGGEINANAFADCSLLETVTIDNIDSVGGYAFNNCSALKTVEVNATEISEYAFSMCTSLENVKLSDGVEVIGDAVFETCTSLAELELPETVTKIGKLVFNDCNLLTELVIPKSVTDVSIEAFVGCFNLKYVFFVGNEEDVGNEYIADAKIHYGSSTHTFNENYTVDVKPTCTEKGRESQHCKYCEETLNSKEIKENGHTSVKGGTEKAHTICDVCKEILSAEHEFASKITTEPTSTEEGVKTYTCECGYSYEEVIPCLVPGEIKAEDAESNSFSATVVDINSIVTKLQLTEEEKALIEQGADMKIVFKLSDIGSAVNTAEKEAILNALTKDEIGTFLDIQLVKQIGGMSTDVKNLSGLISVSVELPAELINNAVNVKRSYSVLRYHDGDEQKVTTLNSRYDEATNTLTFDTDRFSTYAIVYSDVVVSSGEGVPGTPAPDNGTVGAPETPKDETTSGTPEAPKDDEVVVENDKNNTSTDNTTSEDGTSKDDVPKAGVISTTSIWLGAMAISGFGALLVSKKKKED